MVTDAWYAALAIEHGCTFITMDRVSRELPSPRLSAAFDHAREAHGSQTRKGTAIPYISHLMLVRIFRARLGSDHPLFREFARAVAEIFEFA